MLRLIYDDLLDDFRYVDDGYDDLFLQDEMFSTQDDMLSDIGEEF